MKYCYWIIIVLAVIALLISLYLILVHCRKKKAAKKVRCLTKEEKERSLDKALAPFGFAYERGWDCIISRMDPWQREMGYCRQYDEWAPAMNMIMDCEPVYFSYNGRQWLLEFWKGQYGCTTGAEIGLYYNEEKSKEEPQKLFYTCARDDMRLPMQFVLWKDGKRILERSAVHWWLTGFLPGEYSKPKQLKMEIAICFPNQGMRNAFYEGLLHAGYLPEEIRTEQLRISFLFDRPRTGQPSRFGSCYRFLISLRNRRYCRWYLRASGCFQSTLDRISFLGYCFPFLYRKLICLGMRYNRKRLEKCRRRRR